jgi:hypothetical protein
MSAKTRSKAARQKGISRIAAHAEDDKETFKEQNLWSDAAAPGVDELRDECEEEQGCLRVQDLYQYALSIDVAARLPLHARTVPVRLSAVHLREG